jgi:tape measure domain-containing protein
MAKTLEELLIKLGVDGIDEVKQLKGSLRQLQQTAKISDQDIEKLAKGIKNYTRVVGTSEKAVRGQIAALKGAREQAQIGGKAYNDLTRDIERYENRLKSLGNTSESTGKKALSAAQILAQFPARKPTAFSIQINQLNKDLGDLKVNTDQYVLQLRKIQEREDSFRQAQARQSVIARAQTAAGAVVDPRAAITISTALPKTTAALSLRVSELKENLQNLDFTSNQYRDTQREILSIEKQLADATNQRIEAIKGVTEQQRRAEQLAERSRGRKQRLLANQAAADAEYNAALGAHIAAPAIPARQLSSLYQSISQISAAGMSREVEMMGNSYRKVAADINLAARAGGNSISSLQGQRIAFDSLRNVLDPTSREFRQVSRQIQTLDKRLGRLTQTTSRFSKANLLQGAGAVASSAIFGGPLGALGSLGGFVLGGPGGAALGGGLGASANILVDYGRQIAEINTQLNLSKQTLALASNGQKEYNTLLEVARNISRDYAVSLKETIGGFSQVAVAARANNLTLQETETIFRGLVSAGIAFGKSQQDIDAIVRATVQVLSKGKLSAEELQGQIGERLPGAVAKFAEATGRSLPQLAKDLKAGTVQISDFVDFSKKQLFDYDKVAKLIADGPEKAGARLKLALEESAENYGGFFQRVGAKFQDFGTDLLNFFNDNQETIQNFVIDSIIAFKNLALEVKLAFEDIKRSILFLKPVLDAFTAGIDVIGKANRRQRALQAAGFDDKKAREDAATFARENIVTGSEISEPLEFQRIFRQKFNQIKGEFVRRGEQILREQTGDTVPGREALREQLFGDFIPYTFGQYPPGRRPDGITDPTGDADKDISDAMMNARINGMREIITLADVEAKLANDLLQISLDDLKVNEEIVAKAQAHFNAEQSRLQIEKQLETLQANIAAQVDKAKLATGEITQEEFNRRELARERLQLEAQLLPLLIDGKITMEEMEDIIESILAGVKEGQTKAKSFVDGLKEVIKEATNLNDILAEYGVQAVNKFANTFADFVATGKASFKEMTASILQDLARIFARMAFFSALKAVFPGLGIFKNGGVVKGMTPPTTMPDSVSLMAANGMAFAKNKIVPYAKGGVVNKPTLFQYASGGTGRFGLMGEAGAEAIMPLRRGRNGRLGVEAASGATSNIVVNVDASGTQVQGDDNRGKQLGGAISAAVQAELIKQRRPGGLLAS